MTADFLEEFLIHFGGSDDFLAASVEHVGVRPIPFLKAAQAVGEDEGLAGLEGVEFPRPHARGFFSPAVRVAFHHRTVFFGPCCQNGVGPSPRGVVEQRDGDVRLFGFLVPHRFALGDDGSHDLRDGAGKVGNRAAQNGSGFGSDGRNDVVDELEFLLRLGHLFLLLQVLSKASPHLEHRFANFVQHLFVVGEGFFGFGGELNVGAGQVNEDGRGTFGHPSSAGLVQSVLTPIHGFNGFGEQTTALLVHERDAVGEPQHLNGLVGGHSFTENQADLDLERIALGDGGRARHRRDETRVNGLRQPLFDEQLLNGRQTIRGRVEQFDRLAVEQTFAHERFKQGSVLFGFHRFWLGFFIDFSGFQQFFGRTGGHP